MSIPNLSIQEQFEQIGGEFLVPAETVKDRLSVVKAFVFDWDGVFNNGEKYESGSSNFNEVDSMGSNLLRFSFFNQHKHLPYTAIISGEHNKQSFFYAKREHFNSCYYKVSNKLKALEHICDSINIKPKDVAYFYDDVLDLSIAQTCGLRILINRKAGVLFKNYIRQHHLADYITANDGNNYGIREACELLMGLGNSFDTALHKRTAYDDDYAKYISLRNSQPTQFYTLTEGKIAEEAVK